MAHVDESIAQLVVEINVHDLDRSLHFYRALGFELVRLTGRFAVLSWEGHLLFLSERTELPDFAGQERVNVRVMVASVDILWARAHAIGATITAPVADRLYGLRDFTVRDPDGLGLRFASRLPPGVGVRGGV